MLTWDASRSAVAQLLPRLVEVEIEHVDQVGIRQSDAEISAEVLAGTRACQRKEAEPVRHFMHDDGQKIELGGRIFVVVESVVPAYPGEAVRIHADVAVESRNHVDEARIQVFPRSASASAPTYQVSANGRSG